ncbi:hypothetical protein PLEOSDRAFT_1075248 [Pleurotus ostreatus PC15]|uniref:Uncharacterized protein n=1 Tax=Pleurotus ostreatus (strain PC15) TaxID=1137138 RepID=A0A067NSK2_PLEO1|nr:hypothetical protein PLEOSDRAFT_1075248 [Pleurotus ostreatus PC15]
MPSGSSGFTSHTSGTSSLGAFSDEYDLGKSCRASYDKASDNKTYHSDPQILHDVQKAMRLKARREARIKSGRPAHLPRTSPTPPDVSSPPRQTVYQPPVVSSPQQPTVITNSEVDFGPSIAANTVPVVLHPVPSSTDHGATLDWDDEREKVDKRWSLSLPKRKGKEKIDNSASSDSGKGDEAYKRKISKIKGKVTNSTLKKADITSQQLERKYKLVYDRLGGDRVNPLNISRWWLSRDNNTKDALEREEPLTWLKHLDRQRTPKERQRFSWHLPALVMEEFFRAQRYPPFMETILEDPSSPQYSEKPMPFVPGGTLGLPTIRVEQESEKDKQRLHQEYELKLRLLDDLNSQNTRVRQTLNRVANTIREQDALHASFTAMLDVPHVGMPQDVLDAFGHDPAAVTGSTRRLRGWEAVEDIHLRVLRQRDVLRRFIYSVEEKTPGPMKSVLDHPIASLTRALEDITVQHEEITVKAQEVAKVLQSVKALHADVKAEYNETLAQTSVVYPELSYIVALEESYKDQYQQVWEFGMDALTFLLDNVTPFWRTYGKTLGVDIQDFLIIPLYRNEFTGEAKRYPIKHIPRRSFRHWLGFLIFFVLTSAMCFLQCRAAITSSRNYRLQIIAHSGFRWLLVPFVWVSIVIQWSAFLVELCMLIVQVAVTAWWLGWILRIFD